MAQDPGSGAYEVTDAGRVAMEASEPPSRLERWALGLLVLAGGLYAVAVLGEWLFG